MAGRTPSNVPPRAGACFQRELSRRCSTITSCAISVLPGDDSFHVPGAGDCLHAVRVVERHSRNQVPATVVAEYWLNVAPYLLYNVAPLVMLLAVLVTFGLMQRSNEITAIKATGTSIYRIAHR